VADPNLQLGQSEPIVDAEGRPTLKFQAKWQRILTKLDDYETRITALEP
jgi:hypothetical protein